MMNAPKQTVGIYKIVLTYQPNSLAIVLKTSKEDGINTLYIGEESINSLAQRGEITALLYSELKRMIDDESREIVKILDENTKELKKARNVLKEEGFGIDTFEDDFLNFQN